MDVRDMSRRIFWGENRNHFCVFTDLPSNVIKAAILKINYFIKKCIWLKSWNKIFSTLKGELTPKKSSRNNFSNFLSSLTVSKFMQRNWKAITLCCGWTGKLPIVRETGFGIKGLVNHLNGEKFPCGVIIHIVGNFLFW